MGETLVKSIGEVVHITIYLLVMNSIYQDNSYLLLTLSLIKLCTLPRPNVQNKRTKKSFFINHLTLGVEEASSSKQPSKLVDEVPEYRHPPVFSS